MTKLQPRASLLVTALSPLLIPSLVLMDCALADVNTRDGAFSKSFQDFGMERIYNSRSLDMGGFGFGWCSEWDTTLDLRSEKRGTLSSCRAPRSVSVTVEKKDPHWTFRKDGATWFFLSNGVLFKIRKPNGTEIQADRDPKTQLIHSLRSSRGEKIQFLYEDQNLKQMNSNQGFKEKYQYDELHNLLEVSRWQKSQWQITEQMTYDTGRDLTLGYISANGCEDSFTYLRPSPLETATVVQRKCPGLALEITKYRFFFQTHTDGTMSLDRMAVTSESGTTRLSFHERTGLLQSDGLQSPGGLK